MEHGYQLRDLTREWGHLHMCVMDELDHYALGNPDLETAVMSAARQAWSQLCWDGISDSSTQYWHLNQVEATGHIRDLEQALSILSKLDQTRAAAWRETAHDLQGGLGLVTLASSVLDRENLSEPARHEFSDLVRRGVSSLRDMLNDFMSLARLDAGLEQRNVATFDAATLLTDFRTTSDMTDADIAKAPTLPSLSDAPPPREIAGEGVGLSIVKRLCELLDASLELETSPGKGSTFRVILPRRHEAGGEP